MADSQPTAAIGVPPLVQRVGRRALGGRTEEPVSESVVGECQGECGKPCEVLARAVRAGEVSGDHYR